MSSTLLSRPARRVPLRPDLRGGAEEHRTGRTDHRDRARRPDRPGRSAAHRRCSTTRPTRRPARCTTPRPRTRSTSPGWSSSSCWPTGGLAAAEQRNIAKADAAVRRHRHAPFYANPVAARGPVADERAVHPGRPRPGRRLPGRSRRERGLIQLKGHRSVGGMRASLYNAMPIEGVQALVDYLPEFAATTGLSAHDARSSGSRCSTTSPPAACERLPWDRFTVSADATDPHAILLRSADLHAPADPGVGAGRSARAGFGDEQHPGGAPVGPRESRCSTPPAPTPTRSRSWCWPACCWPRATSTRALTYVTALTPTTRSWSQGRGGQEDVRRLRAGRAHPRGGRARQDRLPGRRRGDQARDARDRLRPGDHRRGGLESAVFGAARRTTWVTVLQAQQLPHPARPAGRCHPGDDRRRRRWPS